MSRRLIGHVVFVVALCALFIPWNGTNWGVAKSQADQTPREPCRECGLSGSGPSCICIQYPLYYNGMYYFYYAHIHDDCENCASFESIIYMSTSILESQDCEYGECSQDSAAFTDSSFHLNAAFPADFDLTKELHPAARCQVNEVVVGQITTPAGRIARVKVFHLKCTTAKSSEPEFVSFGVEIEDNGTLASFSARSVEPCKSYQHAYRFDLDGRDCTVITVE